jgi:hypothetical protein
MDARDIPRSIFCLLMNARHDRTPSVDTAMSLATSVHESPKSVTPFVTLWEFGHKKANDSSSQVIGSKELKMVYPEGFEPPTPWSVARCSIH